MPFQVSPGVNVSEIDLTTIVPAVTSTVGAIGGVFRWGPVEERVLISSEDELVNVYGKPTSSNFETFFTAANFLAYGNQLFVSRAAGATNYNAVANTGGASSSTSVIKNNVDYTANESTLTSSDSINFYAKYPGSLGNSLKISVCPDATAYSGSIAATTPTANADLTVSINVGASTLVFTGSNTFAVDAATDVFNTINIGDYILIGNSTIGTQYVKVKSVEQTGASEVTYTIDGVQKLKGNWSYQVAAGTSAATRYWEYFNSVDSAPGKSNYFSARNANTAVSDEMHIVVADEDGAITGTPGQILEVWKNVSRASDARGEQGGSIYWKDVLKNNSQWVWPGYDLFSSTTAASMTALNNKKVRTMSFAGGGSDDAESSISVSKILTAYDLFSSSEDVDISLILAGRAYGGSGEQVANYIIDNVCEVRKDCVAFITPPSTSTVNVPGSEMSNVVAFRNLLRSTSYAVLDSGHKYQYDKYNDVYRWVPMNGDIAGLCVRTDNLRDPWFSPAGFNRGAIKNVVKLAFNPDKADRDQLYKNGVNPVVNFPGQGVVLYGDKTLLNKPSAFDRINVRRLFIVLEKAIAKAAQSSLFEMNDDFTRAAFRNLVEPYLRDIQGRRGIYDFRVVCDTTNNTPEVIDRNEFRGDIYIKPARSINFIQLNFVAVRTGVEFDEIVGKF
jgi:phage tail sheath protein FI